MSAVPTETSLIPFARATLSATSVCAHVLYLPHMKPKRFGLVLIACAGALALTLSAASALSATSNPHTHEPATSPNQYAQYRNDQWHFSIVVPRNLAVTTYDSPRHVGQTIQFSDASTSNLFQITAEPYADFDVTLETPPQATSPINPTPSVSFTSITMTCSESRSSRTASRTSCRHSLKTQPPARHSEILAVHLSAALFVNPLARTERLASTPEQIHFWLAAGDNRISIFPLVRYSPAARGRGQTRPWAEFEDQRSASRPRKGARHSQSAAPGTYRLSSSSRRPAI
jgi:hypothetical protein